MKKQNIKILYHIPSIYTVYANRTIYNGFKNAFLDLGYEFYTFTSHDKLEEKLKQIKPNIFITCSHIFWKKDLNFELLNKYRKNGMVMFTKIDFWNSPMSIARVNEAKSLKDDLVTVEEIKNGDLGDIFFHVVEQGDPRMDGFKDSTGKDFVTIPLAADKISLKSDIVDKFKADISFIGTYLPDKRKFFKEYVFPLRNSFDLKLYGQDWTFTDRAMGWIQRIGQYFNLPYIESIKKPSLELEDEGKIYASSLISINVHEQYQREFGGDCNQRTFNIPFSNGFEITDDVKCIRKYFNEDEIVIAKNKDEWFEKINYYIKNPDKRIPYIKKGRERVEKDHTYNNRANQIIDIYNSIIK